MNIEEKWEPVPNYSGLYAISNLGNVKRLTAGTNTYAGKILKPLLNRKTGYLYVKLTKDGKVSKAKIHLLVGNAFLGVSPDPNYIINHMDGNKTNNTAGNLEWLSRSENTKHAIRMGLQKLCYNENNGNSKLTNEQVQEIKDLYYTGLHTQKDLASRFGISLTYINYLLKGKYRGKN